VTDNSDNEILRHYREANEASRLGIGWFQLEQARTQELVLRHIPAAPATVLDIGGGAGVYALWLASRGYQVHLIDLVPRHIEQASAASAKQPLYPLISAVVGDARRLEHADQTADAILLLGPLYHLRNL
jgi:ubiquinone/menaquinone biosynthesis C-methylase UbiE